MSEEEQRIAIAEACGWELCKYKEYSFADSSKFIERDGVKHKSWKEGGGIPLRNLPDYLNDLNAMAQAESWLINHDRKLWMNYAVKLFWLDDHSLYGSSIHATAAQRAEAFLRCIGKWRD